MARVTTAQGGKIQKRSAQKPRTILDRLDQMAPQLARALPKHLDADRLTRIAITALRNNEKLRQCTEMSFFGSLMQAAQLGLEPNTALGYCYLIPYWNKRQNAFECQFQMGYQGMIELPLRSGKVTWIQGHTVHDGDKFSYQLGAHPDLTHVPADDNEDSPVTHAYAVAKLAGGDAVFQVVTIGQIERRRARSASNASGRGSPWDTDYDAMCAKTAVRALYKWLPKSPEMATAAALDEAPEYGGSQRALWSPEVSEGLLGAGVEQAGDDGEVLEDETNGVDDLEELGT